MHMATGTKRWTLEELHRLPDDGNKYELVRGDLFVTPPPSETHETILARLSRILDPFVATNGLGMVYHPRAVMRFQGSEVEPDLMVRKPSAPGRRDWDDAPIPILVVEVLSGSTRRRDHNQKREFYLDAGVAEYWIIDPERQAIHVLRHDASDRLVNDVLTWTPTASLDLLRIDVPALFLSVA
jgi:Uma2 family endonuclease